MTKFFAFLVFVLGLHAQMLPVSSLPGTCTVGQTFVLTTGAQGTYQCTAPNVLSSVLPQQAANTVVCNPTGSTASPVGCAAITLLDPRNAVTPHAKCDGTTNDAGPLQATLNLITSGSSFGMYLPGSCLSNSLLTFNDTTNGPLTIMGNGPTSKLLVGSSAGGLQITGWAGLATDHVLLKDFQVVAASGGVSAYGIQLLGVAEWGAENVDFLNGSGSSTLTIGTKLSGSQQGHLTGGSSAVGTDVLLEDYTGGAGAVASNGNWIGGGRSAMDTTAFVNVTGGASDVWISGFHETGSTSGIIVNQTLSTGGTGHIYVDHGHFEANGSYGVNVLAGQVEYSNNDDFNTGITAIHVANGATAKIASSLINGALVFDATPGLPIYLALNSMFGPLTNNAGAGNVYGFGNSGTYAFPDTFLPVTVAGSLTITNQTVGNQGSTASPSFTFSNNTQLGFWAPSTGSIDVDLGNSNYYQFSQTAFVLGTVSNTYLSDNANGDLRVGKTAGASDGKFVGANLSLSGSSVVLSGLGSASGTPSSLCLNTTTVTVNAALTCTVSSRIFKTRISAFKAKNPTALLMELKPAEFAYKDAASRLRWGFIAEDVAKVDPKLADAYDADGVPRSLDQNAILALAVKTIQDQQREIEELQRAAGIQRKSILRRLLHF